MDDEDPPPPPPHEDQHQLLSFEARMRAVLLQADRLRAQAAQMAAESQAADSRRR